MADRFDPQVLRRVRGGLLSAALHVALLIVIFSSERHVVVHVGDAPAAMLMQLEENEVDHSDIVELPRPEPEVPTPASADQLHAAILSLALPSTDLPAPHLAEPAPPEQPSTELTEPTSISTGVIPASFAMSDVESALLSKRLERLAEESRASLRTDVTWQQDGRQYSAVLIRERANDGTALERVIAQVSTSNSGKQLTTTVNLRRLAFSQFTQMVDHWDPMVQLHADEIVGRFHSNSQVKLLHDSHTAPKFLGKVTTAARSFDTESHARRKNADIFRGGFETRARRIELPESSHPFESSPKDDDARIHEFASDAHIRFFPDGSYAWHGRDSRDTEYVNEPSGHPVYFVAAPGTTLYVQGVVAGRVLIYSPHRIVIEGSLTYASDPRDAPDSNDFVGLVSNRYVEVAPPGVTGPGDLEIHAAIFAGRRFVVRNIDHPRSATLRVYGSLAAGSLSATEPRYATTIEYDRRFEHRRPPGFPSTDRYEATDWDARWVEAPNAP